MERRDKAETIRNEKVVNCLYQNRNALFRLVCFPWGGGDSTYFAKWGQDIPNSVEVHAIRLAGRESRLEEPFASDMNQIVDEIACALLPIIQGEYFAFFGHSMGSFTAFFTALHLKEKYNLEPVHLFVSSLSPPHVSNFIFLREGGGKEGSAVGKSSHCFPYCFKSKARIHLHKDDLCKEEIFYVMKKVGGIPDKFFDKKMSPEFVTRLLADLHILNDVTSDIPSKTRLSCDITCFSGSEDIPLDMEAWKDVTSGSFDSFVLPGNHFYLMEPSNTSFIKKYITKTLEISAFTS
ncbi:S-acyl fatty acid synthase thioesterase, medium chain [Bos indicus]|uniref:oleoyl-[acyl-carrier-protein] hydrolase n=1 Tax=Bos indicus TaxID=9915 RepID=A0ABM4TDB2_BOSIN